VNPGGTLFILVLNLALKLTSIPTMLSVKETVKIITANFESTLE
jgi:hypothetical protein